MADGSIVIRSWEDEDEPALLELQRAVSGEGDLTSPEFFDWQYRQNPAGRAFIACAQEPGGMMVAQYVTIPVRLKMMGMRALGSLAVNAATHPDYRRLNLFFKCSVKAFEAQERAGVSHTFAFPTVYAYLGSTQKMGFHDLGPTNLLMKLHDPEALLAERGVSRQLLPLGALGGWLLKAFQKKPQLVYDVEEVNSFDGLAIEKLAEPARVAVDADDKFLNWRYISNPRRRYRVAVARGAGEIAGLVVYGIQKSESGRWGVIMELMLSPTAGIGIVESLMNHVFSSNVEAGCSVTLCLASPGSRKEDLLKRCGFWIIPKRMRLKGLSTGVLLCRNSTSLNGDIKMEDIDLVFGMHDVL
ncbi:MAG: GNAT family N-acetyltransferase [Desulfomonile tiedjei]|uniref:GNAT family N-acetyltransferase n=1 Tax=Desulfomonile tiedjei TaxID=2358 RepID=A0A9D6V5K8_9BACT|nr:GNAT family N-acetyltransferase [Desulfomonile tiedjei]